MDLLVVLGYAVLYLVGYYGSHMLNLLLRRVVFTNLRVAGLVFVALVAVIVYFFIESNAPSSWTAVDRGYAQGKFVIGPVLILGACIAVRMWFASRKLKGRL